MGLWRRCLRDLALIPLIAFLVFQMMRILPLPLAEGKFAQGPAAQAELRGRLGFNRPLGFLEPWRRLVRDEPLGNEGTGFRGREVLGMLQGSLRVGGVALALALALAVGYALARAWNRRAWVEALLALVPTAVYGTPAFVLALVAARLAGGGASTEPDLRGYELLLSLVIAIGPGAFLGSVLHQALEAQSRQLYMLTALAKGLSPFQALLFHALPNALGALADVLGLAAASLLAGSFVAEKVFNVPYFGLLYVRSVEQGEVALVVIATTVFAAILILASLGAELLRLLFVPQARAFRSRP
jgi:oligopeptide transport system permease protein